MRWLLAIAATGCGFTHGTVASDARDVNAVDALADAPTDVLVDAPPMRTCYEQWLDGTIRFDTPVALSTVNSPAYDRDPFLTADERTLYLSSARAGTSGGTDVWVATRPSIDVPFSTPMKASEFNSTSNESKLSMSASGTIAVVGSDRPGGIGIDVWESIRPSTTAPWPAMNRTNMMMVESTGNDHDPTLSADGNHLYFAPDSPGAQHLAISTRGNDGHFGPPVALTQLSGGGVDADPSPTPDERILVFSSTRSGNGDLWYTTRDVATDAFGPPLAVPDIATSVPEGDPHLSSDGCRLYFARDLGGSNWDIFVATARP